MHGHKLSLWVRICYDLELSHSGYLASYTIICTTIVTIQYHNIICLYLYLHVTIHNFTSKLILA